MVMGGEGEQSVGSGSPTGKSTTPPSPRHPLSNPLTRAVVRRLSASAPEPQSAEMLGVSPLVSGWHIPVAQRVGMREVRKGGVYFVPHPSRVWVKVMVTEKGSGYSDTCRVRVFDDGTEMTMTGRDMVLACKGSQAPSNLASLPAGHVNEPEVLRILEMRSKIDSTASPYTFAGDSLLAINPLSGRNSPISTNAVELLCESPESDCLHPSSMYKDAHNPEIPHPHTVAEMKYHQLNFEAEENCCTQQWIVGYGISGGGITTACSSVIHYLSWRGTEGSGKNVKYPATKTDQHLSPTNQLLTRVDTIIHSFFGSFTPSNSSSTRAIRVMRMGYKKGGKKLAQMTLELLWPEILRVSDVKEGHRNFNVFYELLSGADKDLRKRITVLPLDYYDYLNGGTGQIDDIDDGKGFKELKLAFAAIGLSKDEQHTIFKALAGILHLGNISFKEEDGYQDGLKTFHGSSRGGFTASVRKVSHALSPGRTGDSRRRQSRMSSISMLLGRKSSKVGNCNLSNASRQSCIKITNKGALELSSSLLGLKSSHLEQSMLRSCVHSCGIFQECGLETAINTRDCIAKAVYSRILSWVVRRCNRALNGPLTCKGDGEIGTAAGTISFINILDPPGFESHSEGNGLAQLLGNFTCESIHSTFNAKAILTEHALLMKEGLVAPYDEPHVGGHDSSRVISLLSGENPPGIFPSLEKVPSFSNLEVATVDDEDVHFVSTLRQIHGHDRLYFPEVLVAAESSVNYSFQVRHFMGVVQYSAHSFSVKNSDPVWQNWVPKEVQELLQTSTRGSIMCLSESSSVSTTDKGSAEESGMTAAYCRLVLDLMSEISNPTMIFGIRPNEKMLYGVFDRKDVAAQIRGLNIVQMCDLARVGGWSHVLFRTVDDLYRPLLGSCSTKLRCVSGSRQLIRAVMWALSISEGNVEWGVNRLTFRCGRATLLQLLEAPQLKSAFISSRLRMWTLRRIVRLGLVWSRGLAALSELLAYVQNKRAALETLRKKRFLSIMRAAMKKTAARTRVRTRWRKVFLVIVAVRVLVAERELSCQAKTIQDEAQERVRHQAAKDEELLTRLDRYEQEERHQLASQEELGGGGGGNVETLLRNLSPPSATPRKRRAKVVNAIDGVGSTLKEAPADITSGDYGRTKSHGLRVNAERRAKVAKLREEVRMKAAVRLLKAEASASTTTACIVRWQRVSLFRAFDKWLEVCDTIYRESNGVFLRLKEGQVTNDNNSALGTEGKEREDENALLCEECEGARRAVFWCKDCPSIYCSICSNFVHSGSRVMRFHTPVLLEELGEDGGRLMNLHINRKDGGHSLHSQLNRRSSLQGIVGQCEESSLSAQSAQNDEKSAMTSQQHPGVTENHYRGVIGNVNKECAIKSCNKPATRGITIRFCEKHYMEFRNALAPKEEEITGEGGAESLSRLTSQIDLLKKQLEATGHQALEFVSLKTAKERMHEAVQKLMAGDDSAEKDIDKWDQTIRMHPDYAKEQEEQRIKWEKENEMTNKEALRRLRTFVPPDIVSSSVAKMTSEGVPRIVAQRIWKVKVLQWARWHPDDVKKVHIADLQAKYSNQGLDVQEMRAVWAEMPEVFDLDSNGKKAQWRSFFSTKLRELTEKEAQGKLNRNELQAPAWKGLTEGPYDPHIPLKRKPLQKSTAFDPTEKPTATILRGRAVAAQQLDASPNQTCENRATTDDLRSFPCSPSASPCTSTGRANILREISSQPRHGKKGGGEQKQKMIMSGSSSLLNETNDQVDGNAPPPPPLPTPMTVNNNNYYKNGVDGARRGLMAEIQKSRSLSPSSQSPSQGGGSSSKMDRGDVQNALFAAIKARRVDSSSSSSSDGSSAAKVVDQGGPKTALFDAIKARRVDGSSSSPSNGSSAAKVVDQGGPKTALFDAIKARRVEPDASLSSDGGPMKVSQGGAKTALFDAIKSRRVGPDAAPSSKCKDSVRANSGSAAQHAPFDGTRANMMSPTARSQSSKVSNSSAIDERGTKSLVRNAASMTPNKVNSTPAPPPLPTKGVGGGTNALFSAIKSRRVDGPQTVSASAVSNSNGVVIDGSRTSGKTQNALFAAIRARRIDSPSQDIDPIAKSKDVDGKNLLLDAIRARRVE